MDPVASKTMRISGLKQREQPEKVTISTQTCHSLYAKSVDEYVCQAQAQPVIGVAMMKDLYPTMKLSLVSISWHVKSAEKCAKVDLV